MIASTAQQALHALPTSAADPGQPGGIAGFTVDMMEALGAPGAGLAVALENLFPPIPSEVILPLAGFTAAQGSMSLVGAIVWTTIGSVVGALTLYWIGALVGVERLRLIAERMPLLDAADVDKSVGWFDRHGEKAVFFGRMVPLVRSFVSIPAGVQRMNLLRFTLLTGLGSLIWNSVFIVAGYQLGRRWYLVENVTGPMQKVVVVVLAILIIWWVVRRVRVRRARDAQSPEAHGSREPE